MEAEAFAIDDDPEQLLSECLIFRALDDEGRRLLASRTKRASFRAGSAIFHVGDPGRSMMVIARGTVRLTVPAGGEPDIQLAELGRGGVLGDIALLDGKPRTATAIATTDCEMLLLDRTTIGPLLRANPRTSLALVELLCERLRQADTQIAEIGTALRAARG